MNGDLSFILAKNGPELVQGVNMAIKGRKAKVQLKEQEGIMEQLMNNRQKLENPALNMTNPFANLSVATQAAEMQMQQTDQALANTLDTLRATGAGAGGATALAQAALRSKKGIAASIENQESANEKLRAQGQANLEARATAEQMRLQGIQIGEGQRMQEADAAGKAFVGQMQENRWNNAIARHHSEMQLWQQAAGQASADKTSSLINGLGQIASIFGGS